MKFEIDMLSVGRADAIILRYFNRFDKEVVIVIDAGRSGDGKKVLEHIENHTDKKSIDLAICTHPDKDHIGGFFDIVGKVKIDKFWIHNPANHRKEVEKLKGKISKEKPIHESLSEAESLISLIKKNRIVYEEPFAGLKYDKAPLIVVGPKKEYYQELLSDFRDIGTLLNEGLTADWLQADDKLQESEMSEKLDRKKDESKENNSSAIILFTPSGSNHKYLFTGDAGPIALRKADDFRDLSGLYWLDVPHHGSVYNLKPDLINRFKPKYALISCKKSDHYPIDKVVDALRATGCLVYPTYDSRLHYYVGLSLRPGECSARPM
ncbi:ComEC/Rec2 family competence protein [Chitinophaga sp. Cy-1792]|uniref:ComEC/Rec2 family competence protein n=1 Tax=Chitinophaga sp. Cy-1792 TaxID=2608339 RepID=UPI00141DD25C|nr:MBL fold metallo-hydrolase [Chitinophaga sp. Cy-1792]NIG56705.1 MBL fold metallo-hydrolase [Chitinophaga sp. Cy-1792]